MNSRLHRDTADKIAAAPSIQDGSECELMANEPSTDDQPVAIPDQLMGEAIEVVRMVVEASDLAGVSGPLGDAARAILAKWEGSAS